MQHPFLFLFLLGILIFAIPKTNAQDAKSTKHRINHALENLIPPALETEALARGFVLGNISSAFESKEVGKGDEITFLAVLTNGQQRQEWLINFRWTGESTD